MRQPLNEKSGGWTVRGFGCSYSLLAIHALTPVRPKALHTEPRPKIKEIDAVNLPSLFPMKFIISCSFKTNAVLLSLCNLFFNLINVFHGPPYRPGSGTTVPVVPPVAGPAYSSPNHWCKITAEKRADCRRANAKITKGRYLAPCNETFKTLYLLS